MSSEAAACPLAVQHDEAGFSLVEIFVGTAVTLTVIGAVMQVFVSANVSYRQARQVIDARNNAAAATDMMVRLVRMATTINPDPDGNGVLDSVRVVGDWNPLDGDTLDPYEDVRFTVFGGQLLKREPADAAAIPFADNVTSVVFAYFSPTGAPIANPMAVDPELLAFVTIGLTTPPVEGRPGSAYSASASVRSAE